VKGEPKEPTLVELDSRGRAVLGAVTRHRKFLATREPDGTLILTPVQEEQ
jgi:prophage tail gpP-like protein